MQFLIPYRRYYISYELDTKEYLVLSSTSETDFEYVKVDVCQTLGEAVKSVDKRMKG